jgi:hypothetical protein
LTIARIAEKLHEMPVLVGVSLVVFFGSRDGSDKKSNYYFECKKKSFLVG